MGQQLWKSNKVISIIVILFLIIIVLRFGFDICNLWICLSGLGLIVIWQILQDYKRDNKN